MKFELEQAGVGAKKGGYFTTLEELCKEVASSLAPLDDDIPF